MRYCKAVVLVEHYSPDINILLPILLWESFGKGYRKVIESRDGVLWETKRRVSDQPEDVQRPGDIHRHDFSN